MVPKNKYWIIIIVKKDPKRKQARFTDSRFPDSRHFLKQTGCAPAGTKKESGIWNLWVYVNLCEKKKLSIMVWDKFKNV